MRELTRRQKLLSALGSCVLVLLAGFALFVFINAKLDLRQASFYLSLIEAQKAGAIDRGWIPNQFLPHSSRSIREIHELSPSTEWCAFNFDPLDSAFLRTNLRPVDPERLPIKYIPKPGVTWWPSVLEKQLDVQKIQRDGYDLYFVQQPANSAITQVWLFAIDQPHGRGFFFSK